MAGCCGRDGGSRRVGVALWVLAGLLLLGIWVARQVGLTDPETPAGAMTGSAPATTHSRADGLTP
ncbi:MAG: hypothetical protein K2X82_23015 [Gemmataceae bacterium]|nr:hypothetical protein [Gemmataceae bacterium]